MSPEDSSPKLPPNRIRAKRKLRDSLKIAQHTIPLERILHVTFTFTRGTTDKEACAEFSAINRQFLRLFPGGYVRLLAFTKKGAPHFHVIAVTDRDIRTGFNFEAYAQMRELNKLGLLTEEQKGERDALGCV